MIIFHFCQLYLVMVFGLYFHQLPGDIAGNFYCLGDGAPLGYQARNIVTGRQIDAFRQLLDM